jgi:ABC-type Fe3+-hydroxamate transport system substrate-binding protein
VAAARLSLPARIAGLFSVYAFMLVCLYALSACDREAPSGSSDPKGVGHVRIVSLSPAISRTLIDFDLQNQIVGRTPHCASIDQSIPVVGDLINIDYESVIRLKPTHILVQPPAGGIDQRLVELARQHGWSLGQWRLNGRDEIEAMVGEMPAALFPTDQARRSDAAQRSARILNDIAEALSPGADPLFRGRVLIVHSVDPNVLVSGAGTYLDDILATLGGTNATVARGWVTLTLEDIARINPEAIIFIRPGEESRDLQIVAGPLSSLPMRASRNGRIAVARDPDGELPSSGIINVAREFRDILRQLAASPEQAP